MINKNLTIESGLAEIGDPINFFQLLIDENHPITKALKAAREGVTKAIENPAILEIDNRPGMLLGPKGIGLKSTEYIKPADDPGWGFVSLSEQYTMYMNDAVNKIFHLYNNFRIFFRIYDCILESLINAIEHGTDYVQNGAVSLQYITGASKGLISITQTTPGPSKEKLEDLIQNPRGYSIGKLFERGNGIRQHIFNKSVEVNYCDLPGGGFAVLLLVPCADEPSE